MPPPTPVSLKFVALLVLLWLAGMATRAPILAVPPVIPLIHGDLDLSEAQVGFLMGLPSAMFALAAVPGSLLVARLGVIATLIAGMLLTALGGASRGAAGNVWALYGATLAMGFGVAISQPALPRLVRDWMPARTGLGVTVYTNGMLLGSTGATALTVPLVLPLVGGSWRLDLVAWSLPVLVPAVLLLLGPRTGREQTPATATRWWPDWKSPLIWLLGLSFGCNNSIFFGCNGLLPDYLTARGESHLVTPVLTAFNGAQLVASFILLGVGERLYGRAWPFVVFGVITLGAFPVLILAGGAWIVVSAAVLGFALSASFVGLLALPPALSAPQDVQRTAAGMFTISYTLAMIVPTLAGATWDMTGVPSSAFAPFVVCALALAVTGVMLSRYRPRSAASTPREERSPHV